MPSLARKILALIICIVYFLVMLWAIKTYTPVNPFHVVLGAVAIFMGLISNGTSENGAVVMFVCLVCGIGAGGLIGAFASSEPGIQFAATFFNIFAFFTIPSASFALGCWIGEEMK